jgi:serine/threonine protein kinase
MIPFITILPNMGLSILRTSHTVTLREPKISYNPTPMSVIPEGTIIDGIRIGVVLGEGGMGVVYKGFQTTIGDRPIAIKFLKQDAFPDIETLKQATDRMRDEAIAASTVKSRHLVEVYQAGHSDQYGFYISFEYLEGETLFERIQKKGVLSEREIIQKIAKPMLLALVALHDKEILHRDIKPANIQADNKNNYRLSDLGLAHFGDRNAKTATGTFIGTPGYLAPERLSGKETKESDVYSAAMTLVFAAIGRLPFTSQGYNIFQEQVNTPITPIKLTTLGVPAGLAQKLAPALGPVPESRPTAKELLDSLEQIRPSKALKQPNLRQPKQTSAETRIAEQPKPTPNPQSPKSNLKLAVGLVGLIIIAVIGLVFLKPAPKKLSEFELKFKNNWPPKPEMIDLFYKHVEKTLAQQNPKEKLREIDKIRKATSGTPYKDLLEAEFYFSKNNIEKYFDSLKTVITAFPRVSHPLINRLAEKLETTNPYTETKISIEELALLYEIFAFLPEKTYYSQECFFCRLWAIHGIGAVICHSGHKELASSIAPAIALASKAFPNKLKFAYASYCSLTDEEHIQLFNENREKLRELCSKQIDALFQLQVAEQKQTKHNLRIGKDSDINYSEYFNISAGLLVRLLTISSLDSALTSNLGNLIYCNFETMQYYQRIRSSLKKLREQSYQAITTLQLFTNICCFKCLSWQNDAVPLTVKHVIYQHQYWLDMINKKRLKPADISEKLWCLMENSSPNQNLRLFLKAQRLSFHQPHRGTRSYIRIKKQLTNTQGLMNPYLVEAIKKL